MAVRTAMFLFFGDSVLLSVDDTLSSIHSNVTHGTSTSFHSKSHQRQNDKMSTSLSNYQVIAFLKTLPENDPFGLVKNDDENTLEKLKEIYTPLQKLFTKTTTVSVRNAKRIRAIKHLDIPHLDDFPVYKTNALQFWESNNTEVSRYSDKEDKARAFLESARQLNQTNDKQVILQRFVNLAAYKLYRRAFPGLSRVPKARVKEFIRLAGVADQYTDEFCVIIRRGKKAMDFCVSLAKEMNSNGEQGDSIYGPLFVKSLPDNIWDPHGLLADDLTRSIQYFCKLWKNTDEALTASAARTAKLLLGFHAGYVIWSHSEVIINKKKRQISDHGTVRKSKKRNSNAANQSAPDSPAYLQDRTPGNEFSGVSADLEQPLIEGNMATNSQSEQNRSKF